MSETSTRYSSEVKRRFDTAKQAKVIAGLISGKLVQVACDEAGVSRQTYWNWKQKDPEFQKKLEDAELALTNAVVEDGVQQALSKLRNLAPKVADGLDDLLDEKGQLKAAAVGMGLRHIQEFNPKAQVELSGSLESRLQELGESESD